MSSNTALRFLEAQNNNLTSLNVKNGNNSNMYKFDATGNPDLTCIEVDNVAYAQANFTSIDPGVSFSTNCGGGSTAPVVTIPDANFKNALLANLAINTNGDSEIQMSEAETVTTINVVSKSIADLTGISAFSALTQLSAGNNQLTTVDVRDNNNLTVLEVPNNLLNQIQFGNNLGTLDATANQLATLDLSGTSITRLTIGNNLLTSLNLKTGAFFEYLYAIGNPELTCIKVDDVAFAEANWRDNVDEGVTFSTNCAGVTDGVVYIPDANFKAALVGDAAINTNGDSEIQILEAEAFSGTIKVNGLGITDLTGIESFINLSELKAQYNALSAVNLGSNTALGKLHLQNNALTALDLSANTNLTFLRAQSNDLVSLDLSSNTALRFLEVQNNHLISLNVKNGNNSNMYKFAAAGNPDLTCIQVDNVAYAENNFTDVDPGVSFSTSCGTTAGRVLAEGGDDDNDGDDNNQDDVEDKGIYSDVRVFPNPSPREVHVTWNGPNDAFKDKMRLFEATTGRNIPLDFRTNGNKITLDMASQASGQYILQLGNKSYRIIKR